MNCHHARQLISLYLDQRLTGREMLDLQNHFAGCVSCDGEMQSIRQLKSLLRGLHEPRPRRDLPQEIALRLDEAGTGGWQVLCLPMPRPQRGRRLATALALSCLTVLSFALPFAPDAREGIHSASSLLATPSPALLLPAGPAASFSNVPVSFSAAPRNDFLVLTDFSDVRRERIFALPDAVPPPLDLTAHGAAAPTGRMQFTALQLR